MYLRRHTLLIRRTTVFVAFGLLLAALLVGSAAGQPGSVYTIRGTGDASWQPVTGAFGPLSSSNPTSSTGTFADSNGAAPYSLAAGPGIARGTIEGTFSSPFTTAAFNPYLLADATTELTVSGPDAFLLATLNLHVDSTFKVAQCPDICDISVGVGGPGGFTRLSARAGFLQNDIPGLTADPIPGGYHLHGDVATPQFGLSANTPTPVTVSLEIRVSNLSRGAPGSSIFDVGPSTVSFAPSGPVLNVPAGYTVSGPGVVDNHWTDPFEPTPKTFTASVTSAPVGVPVAVQSVDPCAGYDQVVFRLVSSIPGTQGTFEPALDVNPDGSWAGTIVLQSGVLPGSYELRADCVQTGSGGGSTSYATIPFTVTLARFTASVTSAPVGVPVAVQSVDPCAGYDQVVFRLVSSFPGTQGTFEPALDVNPDGSWGGTIVLQSGVSAGFV